MSRILPFPLILSGSLAQQMVVRVIEDSEHLYYHRECRPPSFYNLRSQI
jgi:hypothetical protein